MKGKGKKLAAFVLALGLLLLLCAGALAEEYGVVINTDTLNLRSQGSSSSAWLGQYNRGTWVQIIGSQNNFYRVVTPDGKSGYMSKNYISITGGGYMTSRVALVTNQNGGAFLNFRAQPSYNAQVLGIFYYGVPLLVTGQTNGWYQVQINGQTGYVRSEYVTVSDQIASSTVATIKTPGNTAMNLRSGPGLQYDVIQQFSGDRYVMVLAQGNGWWHVSIDGYTGFMDSSFLTLGLHTAQDIAARNGGGASGGSYAVVNNPKSSQALNLLDVRSRALPPHARRRGHHRVSRLLGGGGQAVQWHSALGGRTGHRMVGGNGQEYRRVRLCYDPLSEAVQSAQPTHPAGGASGGRQLCEPAHQPGYDLRPDRRAGAHGQFRHDHDPRSGLVQGDVERVHRLYADLFPAAVRAVSRGSRAFQKSHPHRRHTMASSQREHR